MEGLKWLGPPKMISVSSLREQEPVRREAFPGVWGYFSAVHTAGQSYLSPLCIFGCLFDGAI